MKSKPKALFAFLFLFVLIALSYANSLNNDFVSDDIGAIKENPQIVSGAYFVKPPYYNLSPRSSLIFAVNKIFPQNPAPQRLVNIVFHFGSSCLVFLLASFYFSFFASLAAAAFFAVHPAMVEAVGWISGGPYSQAGFFVLLCFWIYLIAEKSRRLSFYWLSFLVFYLGLSTSEKSIVFPLVLLVYEISRKSAKLNWKKLFPFFTLSFLMAFSLTFLAKERIAVLQDSFYQPFKVDNPFIKTPVLFFHYLKLLLFPSILSFYHAEINVGKANAIFFLSLLIFAVYIFSAFVFYRRNGRAFFWMAWSFLFLLPFLTPLSLASIFAERYVYLASVGIFMLVGSLINKIEQNVPRKFLLLFLFPLALLAGKTVRRNFDWKNNKSLWLATVRDSPSSHQAHYNLGNSFFAEGNLMSAEIEYRGAIDIFPDYPEPYYNLGLIFQKKYNLLQAREYYQSAVRLKPEYWQAHQNLSSLFYQEGNYTEAVRHGQLAIDFQLNNADLHVNLAMIYLKTGSFELAGKELRQALLIDPENTQAAKMLPLLEGGKVKSP